MCGLAGYSGIADPDVRLALTRALGAGVDSRGGHAAGYVSLRNADTAKGISMARRIGRWSDASPRFHRAASAGEVMIMHARFATCGERDNALHAHPFVVRREGESVLYGAHNGVVYGVRDTAKASGREYTVDSKELFELLADGNLAAIQALSGYGVLTWATPDSGRVNMVRLSGHSDFYAVSLSCGGMAWASTVSILHAALKVAKLEPVDVLKASDVGQVYQLTPGGIVVTSLSGVMVGKKDAEERAERVSRWKHYGNASSYLERDERSLYDYIGGSYGSRLDYRIPEHKEPIVACGFKVGERFTGSDGVEWLREASGWVKLSDMPPSSRHEVKLRVKPDDEYSYRASPGKCIHGAMLTAQCDSCTGPLTVAAKKLASWAKDLVAGDDAPDTVRSFPGHPTVECVEGDQAWDDMVSSSGRFTRVRIGAVDVSTLDLESMTDEEIDAMTDDDWDAICDLYRRDAHY